MAHTPYLDRHRDIRNKIYHSKLGCNVYSISIQIQTFETLFTVANIGTDALQLTHNNRHRTQKECYKISIYENCQNCQKLFTANIIIGRGK